MQQHSNLNLFVKVTAAYIGAIIGAGFASGQEILQFFIMFSNYGLWGVVLATVMFSYLGALVMYLSARFRSTNYRHLLPYLLGKRAAVLMDWLSLIMLVGGLAVMLAGSGAVFEEHLGLPYWLGTALAATITCLVILGGLQGVLLANLVLVPVKIGAIALVCFLALTWHGTALQTLPVESTAKVAGHWAWSSILYVSYNMIVPVAVLSSLGQTVSARIGVLSGIVGGLVLGATAALITMAGLAFYPEVTSYQVPLLFIASKLGHWLRLIMGVLIWLAILTTAIADAHGFASRLAPRQDGKYKLIGVGIVIAALPLAGLNFTKLVQVLYPLFGYAGLLLLGALIISPIYQRLKGNRIGR